MGKKATPQGAGQKTLFSFFAKKPSPPAKQSSSNAANKEKHQQQERALSSTSKSIKEWQNVKVGSRIAVYWPNDDDYYDATVQQVPTNSSSSQFTLLYDDGEMERLDLANETFRFLDENKNKHSSNEQPQDSSNKRRRIQEEEEESEEEFEFEEETEEDDDGSVYRDDPEEANDEEDEEDGQWMVTDDEDDLELAKKGKPKKIKKLKVTKLNSQATDKTPKKQRSEKSTLYETPKFATTKPSTNGSTDFSKFKSGGGTSTESNKVTPTFSATKRNMTKSPDLSSSSPLPVSQLGSARKTHNPIPYVHGAVNPAGSHVHHHLKFLQNPKDAQGRTRDHPLYDAKTLRVDYNELERTQGAKPGSKARGSLSPAARQWWEIKARYFDTVLLFKTGKFYEMFHMDGDVGVEVLDFLYMKGHVAHAGFPEISYGSFSEKLVRAGYKVARVEQTETPQAMKERNKKRHKNTPTAKVVNREVCSILTSGTRTFCYLDDAKGLAQETSPGRSNHGPLLAIREVLLQHQDDGNTDDVVKPVCEYGITLVDAVCGTVTIGQFADDVLRSRMHTLLTSFAPSEILVEGGEDGVSPDLLSLLKSVQGRASVERIHTKETFPKSTAVDPDVRRRMERPRPTVQPWDVQETLEEIHRRGYYPRASRRQEPQAAESNAQSTSRWPSVLRVAVEGKANLAMSSFGAALFYLQRNLIDEDILGMGVVKAYVPPTAVSPGNVAPGENRPTPLLQAVREQQRHEDGFAASSEQSTPDAMQQDNAGSTMEFEAVGAPKVDGESLIDHLALDGTTLQNLDILFNSHSHTVAGSLWSKINHTKSPHGSRLLRAWLLRPLFRKADIDRRASAVEELVSGAAAMAISEARNNVLAKCGDIERLLSRIHSMGGTARKDDDDGATSQSHHPSERAVLYETATHTKRKVGDFSKVLQGLRHAAQIPELFQGIDIQSGMLRKIVRSADQGGCFPDMEEKLDWFFDNFDCEQAANGIFEPSRGMDEVYDEAFDTIEKIERQLEDYKDEMCSQVLTPASVARSQWKYINTKEESKDKYLIELPVKVRVPDDFLVKGKRGKGDKQVNKYRTPVVEQLVAELEHALDVQKAGKEKGMQVVFAKFDSLRNLWAAAAHATAMLDALGSLAQMATRPGYSRPQILECPPDEIPCIRISQGRHPCVENTHNGGEFIPNDLSLGRDNTGSQERVLLLSGPNMGGKSTLLRQTCLIAILAQVGSFVPAEECSLTPIDRIFTRLGATDRILLGQSTFFVELAETAAALRGATRRSLVIMDELGRGTATFDGTAIASATVKHLVEQNQSLTLFATHYHSLLNDWKNAPKVRLGHMECIVAGNAGSDDEMEDSMQLTTNEGGDESNANENITFLYTLGQGACPKSFGINVARLAALPEEVLSKAKTVSSNFEAEMTNNAGVSMKVTPANALDLETRIRDAIESGQWSDAEVLWKDLQS